MTDPQIKARILQAGTGWCAFTHQHDNSKAALAAAREALTIFKERMSTSGFVKKERELVDSLLAHLTEQEQTNGNETHRQLFDQGSGRRTNLCAEGAGHAGAGDRAGVGGASDAARPVSGEIPGSAGVGRPDGAVADPQTARLAEVETLLTLAESMALVAREGPDLDGVRRGSADVIEQLCAALRASETARLQLKPVYEKALKHMRGLYARQTERDTEDLKQLLAEAEPAKQQAEQERDTYRATTREWIAANAPGGWIDNLRASLAQREAEIARQVEQARADVFAQVEAEATRRAPQELRQSDYDQGRWHAYTELADWCQQQKGQG